MHVLQPMCIAMLLIAMMTGVSSVRTNTMIVDVCIVMLSGLSICIVLMIASMINVAGLHCVSVLIVSMIVIVVVICVDATAAAVCVACGVDDDDGYVCVE